MTVTQYIKALQALITANTLLSVSQSDYRVVIRLVAQNMAYQKAIELAKKIT